MTNVFIETLTDPVMVGIIVIIVGIMLIMITACFCDDIKKKLEKKRRQKEAEEASAKREEERKKKEVEEEKERHLSAKAAYDRATSQAVNEVMYRISRDSKLGHLSCSYSRHSSEDTKKYLEDLGYTVDESESEVSWKHPNATSNK